MPFLFVLLLLFSTQVFAGWQVSNTQSVVFTAPLGTPCGDVVYTNGVEYRGVVIDGYTAAFECEFIGDPPPPPSGSDLEAAAAALTSGNFASFPMGGLDTDLVFASTSNSVIEWLTRGYWNPVTRGIEIVGQGHIGFRKHLHWDDATNQWSVVTTDSPLPFVGHGYEHSTVDSITGKIYVRGYNTSDVFVSPNWASIGSVPDFSSSVGAIEFFPEANALVWLDWNADNLWWHKDGSWQRLTFGTFTGSTYAIAVAIKDKVLIGECSQGNLWSLNAQGQVVSEANTPVPCGPTSPNNPIVVDPSNTANALQFTASGNVYRFNGSWSLIDSGLSISNAHKAIISVPEYGVVVIIQGQFNPQAIIYKP